MLGLNPIELLIVSFIAALIFGPRLFRDLRAIYDAAPPEARLAPAGPRLIVAIVIAEAVLLAVMLAD